jgi:hypothetical protein
MGKLTTFKGDPLKLLDELINSKVFQKNSEALAPTFE